jgi:DNA-binding transcriptional LysR family regulator
VLVAQAGSGEARMCPPRTLADLARLPLVAFRACKRIDSVAGQLRSIGLEANVVLRSDYNEAVQGHAAAGLGVALMPRLAVNFDDERTVAIELGDLIPARRIAIAWHADRTPSEAGQALMRIASESGAHVESVWCERADRKPAA